MQQVAISICLSAVVFQQLIIITMNEVSSLVLSDDDPSSVPALAICSSFQDYYYSTRSQIQESFKYS